MTRIAPAGLQRYQRFGFRHVDHHAGQTEQAEWMPTRQGTAYASLSVVRQNFPRCASSPAARHGGPVWPCALVVRYSYCGRYSRAVTTPPAVQSPFASSAFISEGRLP